MPFVIYVAPYYTENARRFLEAILQVPDASVGLISQEPAEWLPEAMRTKLAAFRRTDDAFDTGQLIRCTRSFEAECGPVHRIFSAVEQLQVPVAQVRAAFGIEGLSEEAALNFRDKARMKTLLRQAGIPCARHCLAASADEARQFVAENGFPVIAKPPDGAGSQSTYKAETPEALEQALATLSPRPGHEVLLEEFVVGSEHSFDTFSLRGKPVFHTLTHYYPTPLEVVREPWIQWQVVLPREVEDPQYDDIRQYAFHTLEVLGMATGMSHLEWFRRRDGSIAISEVAARPPGAQFPTLISRANEFDAIEAWANMIIHGVFEPPQRKYAVGAAYLRGQGEGVVKAVHGIDQIEREIGHLVTDAKLPQIGQAASPSYEGEGYIIVRHPETAVVKQALQRIVELARVELAVL